MVAFCDCGIVCICVAARCQKGHRSPKPYAFVAYYFCGGFWYIRCIKTLFWLLVNFCLLQILANSRLK